MSEDQTRLGDIIDDYCPRCRLMLNHAVAGMSDSEVQKVICQTCFSEHAYKHGKGSKKKSSAPTSLFDQVLAKVTPADRQPPTTTKKKTTSTPRYIRRHPSKKR